MSFHAINKLSIVLVIIAVGIGCTNEENTRNEDLKNQYIFLKYSTNQDVTIHKFPILDYSQLQKDSQYHLKYIVDKSSYYINRSNDTVEYLLNTDTMIQSYILINSAKRENISLIAYEQYSINKNIYNVYKFQTKETELIDAGAEYLWVPKFGIIHIKSKHWLHISKLDFFIKNEYSDHLGLLFELIYNDINNTFI